MSDNKNSKGGILVNLPDSVEEAVGNVVKNVTDKLSKSVGETVNDIWFLATHGITEIAEKKRIKMQYDLDEFKRSLDEKIKALPPEKLVEPDTRIVATAIEDAKFAVSDKEIRDMFAGLIAASVDIDRAESVHPSFSSILKQMASLEATLLRAFFFKQMQPICEYRLISSDGMKYQTLKTNVFLVGDCDGLEDSITKRSVAISSLERLGLLAVEYGPSLSDMEGNEDCYKIFYEIPLYSEYLKNKLNEGEKIKIQKGIAKLTPLGYSLLHTCCTIDDFITIDNSSSIPTPDTNRLS